MALANIQVNPTGTFAVTGGSLETYTSIGPGRFANLGAALTNPAWFTIESTLSNDAGKESSYLLKFEEFVPPPAGAPFGSPDVKCQVHCVIKVDTSVYTEASIQNTIKRLSHLLQQTTVIAGVLRGDK